MGPNHRVERTWAFGGMDKCWIRLRPIRDFFRLGRDPFAPTADKEFFDFTLENKRCLFGQVELFPLLEAHPNFIRRIDNAFRLNPRSFRNMISRIAFRFAKADGLMADGPFVGKEEGELEPRGRAFFKLFFLFLFSLLMMGALRTLKGTDSADPQSLLRGAEHARALGEFEKAAAQYEKILAALPPSESQLRCRCHFLAAAVYREWGRKEGSPIDWQDRSLAHFELAASHDATDWGAFAVPAMLASADLRSEKARRNGDADEEAKARTLLEELIANPEFAEHPLLREGVVHRRLGEILRASDPRRALPLVETSRDRRGMLEDGTENLLIAFIHQTALDDPDLAIDHYEKVLRNALAPARVREAAHREREALRSTHIRSQDPSIERLPEMASD